MKRYIIRFYTVTFIAALTAVTIGGCSDEKPGPTPEELFHEKISHSWQVERVTVDGRDVTNAFPNMRLTIGSDYTYTTTNGAAPIWKASGTFQLKETVSSELFDLLRDDGTTINVTELTSTNWKLKFTYTSPATRSQSIGGQYEFTFKAN